MNKQTNKNKKQKKKKKKKKEKRQNETETCDRMNQNCFNSVGISTAQLNKIDIRLCDRGYVSLSVIELPETHETH